MEFSKIKEETPLHAGEYLFHKPTNKIVLCGAVKRSEGKIRYLAGSRLAEDKIDNFRKIKMHNREKARLPVSRCKGCGG
tara:strand:+ start:788 stop:1024 length:237 start_codon:yes stop_codon:yes gene_type:complete